MSAPVSDLVARLQHRAEKMNGAMKAGGLYLRLGDYTDEDAALDREAAARISELEAALRLNFCPRPCNHRPYQFEVGQCVDAGECGCMNHVLAQGGNRDG